jgi:hypothetical protein
LGWLKSQLAGNKRLPAKQAIAFQQTGIWQQVGLARPAAKQLIAGRFFIPPTTRHHAQLSASIRVV